MLNRLSRGKRNWALAIFGLLVLWFSWRIREVLNPLLLGYLLAFIVHPAVVHLERHGWRRRRAVNLIFAVTGLLGAGIALTLVEQGTNLAGRLADTPILEQLGKTGEALAQSLGDWLPAEVAEEVAEDLVEGAAEEAAEAQSTGGEGASALLGAEEPDDGAPLSEEEVVAAFEDASLLEIMRGLWTQVSTEQAADAGSFALRRAGGVWGLLRHWFGSVIGLGFLMVLLPVYTYFLMFELGRIHRFVARYIPVRERARVVGIGRQIGEVIASFFRGRLVVCFLKGVVLTLGLWATGMDYALLLGMGSGFLSLVPFVGPLSGFLLAFIVGLTGPGVEFIPMALRTAAVFAVAEVFEGYYLVPKILGDSLGLHPVVVLVAVFAGGATLGMFGFLIALPLTATLVILVRELVLPALADFADEDRVEA